MQTLQVTAGDFDRLQRTTHASTIYAGHIHLSPGPIALTLDTDDLQVIVGAVKGTHVVRAKHLEFMDCQRCDSRSLERLMEKLGITGDDIVTLIDFEGLVEPAVPRLWILERSSRATYDENMSCVVRAQSEVAARRLASEMSGAENQDRSRSPWLQSWDSTCEPLESDGPSEVIIKNNVGS